MKIAKVDCLLMRLIDEGGPPHPREFTQMKTVVTAKKEKIISRQEDSYD